MYAKRLAAEANQKAEETAGDFASCKSAAGRLPIGEGAVEGQNGQKFGVLEGQTSARGSPILEGLASARGSTNSKGRFFPADQQRPLAAIKRVFCNFA